MEWNALFREKDLGETTPLPIVLQQKDLKSQYSTQTPYRSVALYNVFVMKRSASDIMNLFEKVAQEANGKDAMHPIKHCANVNN